DDDHPVRPLQGLVRGPSEHDAICQTILIDPIPTPATYVFDSASAIPSSSSSSSSSPLVTIVYDCAAAIRSSSFLFGQFYELVRTAVTRLLGREAGDRDLVTDLTDDTCLRLCEPGRLERFDPTRSSFKTYVNALAADVVRRHRRKKRLHYRFFVLARIEPID